MLLRMPFFGMLSKRSPMEGLIDHYGTIADCVAIIKESLQCYVAGDTCRDIAELTDAIDKVEAAADRIKRSIRNHLPRRMFMAVEKTLFLNYTSTQDDILDAAQDALYWLAMRKVTIPDEFQADLIRLLDDVIETTVLLGPVLKATIGLINGTILDREGTKNSYRKIRKHHEHVRKESIRIASRIYNSDMDFKDIYQLIHFVDHMTAMSHRAEGCADILRSMIAR